MGKYVGVYDTFLLCGTAGHFSVGYDLLLRGTYGVVQRSSNFDGGDVVALSICVVHAMKRWTPHHITVKTNPRG